MSTPRLGDSLSLRARNAVENILRGSLWGDSSSIVPANAPSADEIDALTRRGLRLRLHSAAGKRGVPIYALLMLQRNCGRLTANEIAEWIGLSTRVGSHVCVCRQCGRRLAGSTGSAGSTRGEAPHE